MKYRICLLLLCLSVLSVTSPVASAGDLRDRYKECWLGSSFRMMRKADGGYRVPTFDECMGKCKNLSLQGESDCRAQLQLRSLLLCEAQKGSDCQKKRDFIELYCEYHATCGR